MKSINFNIEHPFEVKMNKEGNRLLLLTNGKQVGWLQLETQPKPDNDKEPTRNFYVSFHPVDKGYLVGERAIWVELES